MPPNDIAVAEQLESQGYFTKAAAGDQRAASLFARLFAYTANPQGLSSSWGWLRKTAGGANVDGYAEDAVCYGSNASDLHNVVDLVIGTGAPGARLVPNTTATVPRRPQDIWERPQPLSNADMAYLGGTGGGTGPVPDPCAACKSELAALKANSVLKVGYEAHGGDAVWDQFGLVIAADYARAGRVLDPQAFRWAGRTMHDDYMEGLTLEQSIAKHRAEWCGALGIPVG